MELVIVAGNFPVRCHGLDVVHSYLNLGSWLGAHITVFSGLFLGLRTDSESTLFFGTIDVGGAADPYCVIVYPSDTLSRYKDTHSRISLHVFGSWLQYTVSAKINFLYFCKAPGGK